MILKRKNLALVLDGNCKPLEVIWSLHWRFGVCVLPREKATLFFLRGDLFGLRLAVRSHISHNFVVV